MQNTFGNADRSERRRAERQRQMDVMTDATNSARDLRRQLSGRMAGEMDLMAAAVSARNLPTFMDEHDDETVKFVGGGDRGGGGDGAGGGGGSPPGSAASSPLRNSPDDRRYSSRRGGGPSGADPRPERDLESDEIADDDDGMIAPSLGASDSARKFLWDDNEDGEARRNTHGAGVYGGGSGLYAGAPPASARERPGFGAKLLRGLVPTFGPDGRKGGGGGGGARRADSSYTARRGSADRAGRGSSFRSADSADPFPAKRGGGGGGGLNIAPRRNSGSGADGTELTTVGTSSRRGRDRFAGYDDENLPPLRWGAGAASGGMDRSGRTRATAGAALCAAFAGRKARAAVSLVLGATLVAASIALWAKGRDGGEGGAPTSAGIDPERLEAVIRRVANAGATRMSDIASPTVPTPQRRAVEWIARWDPARLDPEDDFLLQRYALAALWYGTHDDDSVTDWANAAHWMSGKGICAWYGVTCHPMHGHGADETTYDDDNMVTGLVLESNNVLGELPRDVFTCLTELRKVNMHSNGLDGTLATEVGLLRRLEVLDLGDNSFEGTVPTELGGLDNLVALELSENAFEGTIPETIARLFDTLTDCSLFSNELVGTIPELLSDLEKLESLYLDSNNLNGSIPSALGRLTQLTDLRVRNNDLTGRIPTDLGRLERLEVLYVDANELTGPMPVEFARLGRLEELSLYDNKLSGTLPPELANMTALEHVYLDTNSFTGTIPPQWADLDNVVHLFLGKNQLDGAIRTEMGLMTHLQALQLGHNQFSGTIPEELGELLELRELSLEENKLGGTVPERLGRLTNLEKLLLHGNSLTGAVPGSVCELRSDRFLKELTAQCLESGGIGCTCCTECY